MTSPVSAAPVMVAPVAPVAARAPEERVVRPRSPSLDAYRRVEKVRENTPDDEIRVMGAGRVSRYVTYAEKLLREQNRRSLSIRATGKAISVSISVCEIIKRRFKGLHQFTSVGWTEIVDDYVPLDEKSGLPNRSEKRTVPSIQILLTLDDAGLNKKDAGYQEPLPAELVEERDPTQVSTRRRSEGRRENATGPSPKSGEKSKPRRTARPKQKAVDGKVAN